jgi:hypothetical protein
VIREIAKSQTPIKRWDHPGLIPVSQLGEAPGHAMATRPWPAS